MIGAALGNERVRQKHGNQQLGDLIRVEGCYGDPVLCSLLSVPTRQTPTPKEITQTNILQA